MGLLARMNETLGVAQSSHFIGTADRASPPDVQFAAVDGELAVGQMVQARVTALRHTHSCIQPLFTCGREVKAVAEDLRSGALPLSGLPRITIVNFDGKWYSANNRRLWCLKAARIRIVEAVVGAPDDHFMKGLNTKTDGWGVAFFPPVLCPTCRRQCVNRKELGKHRCMDAGEIN